MDGFIWFPFRKCGNGCKGILIFGKRAERRPRGSKKWPDWKRRSWGRELNYLGMLLLSNQIKRGPGAIQILKEIIYRQTKKPFVLRILYNMGKKANDEKVTIVLFSLLLPKRHSLLSSSIDKRSTTKSRQKTQQPKSQI